MTEPKDIVDRLELYTEGDGAVSYLLKKEAAREIELLRRRLRELE